jgi:ribosomal protein L37E
MSDEAQREPSIVCRFCGAESYNPNDIKYRYCGRCHRWQESDLRTSGGVEWSVVEEPTQGSTP